MNKRTKALKLNLNSMKARLLITLIVACTTLISTVAYVSFKTFENTLISEIGTNRSDVLSQIGDKVALVKSNAYTLSNLYYFDKTLQKYIRQYNDTQYEQVKEKLVKHLDNLTSQFQNSFIENATDFKVVLLMENGFGYCSDPVPKDYDYMNPTIKVWYKKMLFAKGNIIDVANYKDKQTGINYFSVARSISDLDGNPIAYLMININERNIYSTYENVVPGAGNIYIVDNEGAVVSSSIQKLIGFNYFNMSNLDKLFGDKVYTITKMKGSNILFTKHYKESSKFTVLEEISLSRLLVPINRVRGFIVWVTIFATLIIALYVIYLAHKTTKPISELCDFMMQVGEDNLDKTCTVKGFTEISILSQRLNYMLAQMKGLLESVKLKEKQKRKLEISFLQAQINPHFMYNTLFSLRCMVDLNKNEEASQMLNSFIQLLRSTLSNPDEFVTIKQEFQVLKQYADIQHFRYEDKFDIFFEYDEAVGNKKIPKLLIQPLLENAIFHGVEFKNGKGCISITAREMENGEKVNIIVEDNGVGISRETIEKINKNEQLNDKIHVGMVNVKERIQLIYGQQYGLIVESIQWQGTKIIVSLPAID